MQCPKCQTNNPDNRKFCRECGNKLLLLCTQCGADNIPGDKFCGECGNSLSPPSEPLPKELSFDEKLDKIQRYLPQGLTEKILAQRDRIEGEHKQVSVMFCDMEGFTQLSDKLGPEDAYNIMDKVYEILIHKVHDYGGTVNELTGDGIVALFGAPIALEDAPQRAIRSAHSIHREMVKLSDKLKREKALAPVKMRVGIHTGPVVVGTLGNDLRVEFKAVGDTVNLASRIENLAEPGSTYVSEGTFKLTEGFFRFEALGRKSIKGKENPVAVYRVIAPSTRRTRFDVSAERGLTSFVGREREIELLLDGFERAKTGHGQVFSIVAEAGVGKSRLLYEFRKAVTHEDVTFLEGKSLSYSQGVAYHPIIDILKSNFNIQENDEDSEIRKKVQKGLKVLGADDAFTMPYLLELLSVKNSGIDKISQSPEARKEHIKAALRRIVLNSSELRPMIMAFEDLHWIDNSSEDSLKDLMDNIAGAKVFLIITYRPEFARTWGAKSYHSQITLNRLSNRESLSMVAHLLGTEDIEKNLEAMILEKTEGVPFFTEEFVKSLKDLKIIEKKNSRYHLTKDSQSVTIPSTIQDVIMARVDALPEAAKDVLQMGSVIEREFSYGLIKRMTGLPEQDLLAQFSVLKDAELLYERGISPETTYIFKHALTREVVYESILKKKKKMLHEEIGRAIEAVCKVNIDEHYGVLAGHFIKAENFKKGALFSELAAKKANVASSSKEVFEHAKRRIFCVENLPASDDTNRKIIDARTALSAYYLNYSYMAEAYEVVAPIAQLAQEMDYQEKLPMIFVAKGAFSCWFEEDYTKGLGYLNEALRVSKVTNNMIFFWHACWQLGVYFLIDCQFSKGGEYFEKCLEMSKAVDNLLGISSVKSAVALWSHLSQGKIDLASQRIEEALRMAEKSGDIYAKGLAHTSSGILFYMKGLYEKAKNDLLKGLDCLEKTSQVVFISWAAGGLAMIYEERAEYERSLVYYNKAISILLEHGSLSPSMINMWRVSILKATVLNQKKDIYLPELVEYYNKNKSKVYEGWLARDIGEILINANYHNTSETKDWIKKAIEADSRNGLMWYLGRDYALYAEFYKRKGDQLKARENFNKAIEIFKGCSADGWVEKFEKELAEL